MTLNESQRKFIKGRLASVWKRKHECPICISSAVWCFGGIVEVRDFNEGNHCHGASITPLVELQCNTCGHTILFNAITLGVVDPRTGKVKDSQ